MSTASQRPPFSARAARRASLSSVSGGIEKRYRGQTAVGGKFHEYRGFFLLAIALIFFWLCSSFIKPVLVGAIFASVLYPFMLRMARWRVPISIKALLVTAGFTISFLIPVGILVFLGAEEIVAKIQAVQTAASSDGFAFSFRGVMELFGLEAFVDRLAEITPFTESQFRQLFMRGLQAGGQFLSGALQGLLADLPGLLISTIVILFTIFYLLIDGRRAVQFLRENSFFSARSTDLILQTMNSLCYSVIVASIVAGLVQTVLLVLALVMTGTEGVLLIALLTFIASFLPVIGTAPVTIFLTAQALFQGNYFAAIVFGVAMFLIGFSDNLVRPMVLRGGANLHPLVGFVAAFGALETIGFYGLFIGPVVAGLFFYVLPLVARTYPASGAK